MLHGYNQGSITVFLGVRKGLMEERTLWKKIISLWASYFHSFTNQVVIVLSARGWGGHSDK